MKTQTGECVSHWLDSRCVSREGRNTPYWATAPGVYELYGGQPPLCQCPCMCRLQRGPVANSVVAHSVGWWCLCWCYDAPAANHATCMITVAISSLAPLLLPHGEERVEIKLCKQDPETEFQGASCPSRTPFRYLMI